MVSFTYPENRVEPILLDLLDLRLATLSSGQSKAVPISVFQLPGVLWDDKADRPHSWREQLKKQAAALVECLAVLLKGGAVGFSQRVPAVQWK